MITPEPEATDAKKKITSLSHPTAVKAVLPIYDSINDATYLITACGDTLRVFDASTSLDAPELLNEVDAHAHEVTDLKVWIKTDRTDGRPELWVVSASLDGTIRRWHLQGLFVFPLAVFSMNVLR